MSIHIDLCSREFQITLIEPFYSYDSACAVLEDDSLTILQDDMITQIKITNASIIRKIVLDCFGCNFAIYKVKKGYIIYGEVEITMLDFDFIIPFSSAIDTVSVRIKQLEGRMAEVAGLKTHIINYSKTRDVYAAYKKSRHKKEFRAEHADEIAKHEAAKAAFDALAGKPIPKVAQFSEEYAALLSEKKEQSEEYNAAKKEMLDLGLAKQNVDRILGITPPEKQKETERWQMNIPCRKWKSGTILFFLSKAVILNLLYSC